MRFREILFAATALAGHSSAAASQKSTAEGPIVDLGYTLHQAKVNETGKYYAFNNIRYTEPLGPDERFKPAQQPSTVNRTVNDGGSLWIQCPQGIPEWSLNLSTEARNTTVEELRNGILNDPNTREDCLYLDVVVPQTIYEKRNPKPKCKKGAPVLVWVHGGGYVLGQKGTDFYNPSGLIARSQHDGSDGYVYVSLNYRLGMFGFLNDVDGVFPNVGFQDQILAFKWITKNIPVFGGNPDLITVMGESAGGGSIMYHITAEGGTKSFPFKRAVAQSPAFFLDLDNVEIWQRTLKIAHDMTGTSITTSAELAQLDFGTLNKINFETVFQSAESTYTYGPSVDGGYIQKPPAVLLLEGKYDHSVDIMAGHNSHETLVFVLPKINTREKAVTLIYKLLPHLSEADLDYLLRSVYPPPADTNLYDDEYGRASLLVSEMIFVCNTRYLALANGNKTYNYRYQVPPGGHAEDVAYTFWHGVTDGVKIPKIAVQMQRYFSRFIKSGDPNHRSGEMPLPEWPVYGEEALINTFGPEMAGDVVVDDAKNGRCKYWQESNFLGY